MHEAALRFFALPADEPFAGIARDCCRKHARERSSAQMVVTSLEELQATFEHASADACSPRPKDAGIIQVGPSVHYDHTLWRK